MNKFETAYRYAQSYNGYSNFMKDMRNKGRNLTPRMIEVILNIKSDEEQKEQARSTRRQAEENRGPRTSTETISGTPVADATYTVVDEQTGDYVTLRIKSVGPNSSMPKGTQRIAYLFGSDNTRDFKAFAHLQGTKVWPFSENFNPGSAALLQRFMPQIKVILNSKEEQEKGRTMYAMRSGKCARCGRTLTVPASLHRGLGPECAGKF